MIAIPPAETARKVPGYQMPDHQEALLDWDFVNSHMTGARHYWLTTTFRDGRPHAVPVWGLWHNNRLHFEGRSNAGWAQNLRRDPRAVAHPPHPTRVVTVEGRARMLEDNDITKAEWSELDARFQAKYEVEQGSPYWCLEPTKIIAWNGGKLDTMTRWIFPA